MSESRIHNRQGCKQTTEHDMECGIVRQNCMGDWVILSLVDHEQGWSGSGWTGHVNGLGTSEPLLNFPTAPAALDYAARHNMQAAIVGPFKAIDRCMRLDEVRACIAGVCCIHEAGHQGECVLGFVGHY